MHKGGGASAKRQYAMWLNEKGRMVFESNEEKKVK